MDFVSALDEDIVKSATQKGFQSLPDISKALSELTVLKGVGPATASAILAAYAPDVAPFMSDEVNFSQSLKNSYLKHFVSFFISGKKSRFLSKTLCFIFYFWKKITI